jgi:endonuclease-3
VERPIRFADTSMNESKKNAETGSAKKPFDIDAAIPLLRAAVAPYPKAALFELAAQGHASVFEILTACIVSIRTRVATVSTQPHPLVLALALGHADVNRSEPTP